MCLTIRNYATKTHIHPLYDFIFGIVRVVGVNINAKFVMTPLFIVHWA